MTLCPVCNKEYQNLKIHLSRQAKKDEEHRKYVEKSSSNSNLTTNLKTYFPGQTLSGIKEKFVVVKDTGDKVIVQLSGKSFMKLKISKSELNECSI